MSRSISKEMKNVRVAFEVLPDGKSELVCHQLVQWHMVFDIKMEDFRQKVRLVAGGHMTKAPATITYASVVSRETVRIALMIATLNDLEVKLENILNAYVQAPVTDKLWTTLGLEFSKDTRKNAVVVRALYGLNAAGIVFRSHISRCMESLRYLSCKVNPDLWLEFEIRSKDGGHYYTYILHFVDDILYIHLNTDVISQQLHKSFLLKP